MLFESNDFERLIRFANMNRVFFLRTFKPIGKKYALKESEITLLLSLYYNPNSNTAKGLIKIGEMKRGNISILVERLTIRGFIEQKIDDNDRRLRYLYLTEKAASFLRECDLVVDKYCNFVLQNVSKEEMVICDKVFTKIYENACIFTEKVCNDN